MGRLREWGLDWLGRSDVEPSDRKIDDPMAIVQRTFAALGGIVAVLSSPAITKLAPNMNPTASIVLQCVIALVTIWFVHHVVTAKNVVEKVFGVGTQTVRTYRFSTTERLIARGVVGLALLLLLLNAIPTTPAPRACNLTATVDWPQSTGPARPLFLSLTAGTHSERYAVERGKPVAMQVSPEHLSAFSVILEWSDNSRSVFGAFSGCSAVVNRRSVDDRAKVDLAVR